MSWGDPTLTHELLNFLVTDFIILSDSFHTQANVAVVINKTKPMQDLDLRILM